jgi:hypothetical protein
LVRGPVGETGSLTIAGTRLALKPAHDGTLSINAGGRIHDQPLLHGTLLATALGLEPITECRAFDVGFRCDVFDGIRLSVNVAFKHLSALGASEINGLAVIFRDGRAFPLNVILLYITGHVFLHPDHSSDTEALGLTLLDSESVPSCGRPVGTYRLVVAMFLVG